MHLTVFEKNRKPCYFTTAKAIKAWGNRCQYPIIRIYMKLSWKISGELILAFMLWQHHKKREFQQSDRMYIGLIQE